MTSLGKFNFEPALMSASVTFPAFLAFTRINALFLQSSIIQWSKRLAWYKKPFLQPHQGARPYQWWSPESQTKIVPRIPDGVFPEPFPLNQPLLH